MFLSGQCRAFYKVFLKAVLFREIITNAAMHIHTEISDPKAVAIPIGKRVAGKSFEARYTPGTRISSIAVILWKNDIPDLPTAQK